MSPRATIAKIREAIEPWYDWGPFGWQRLDGLGEGFGWYFEAEWLGLKMLIIVGRTPPIAKGG